MFEATLATKTNLTSDALVAKIGADKFRAIMTGKFPKRLTVKSVAKFVRTHELFSTEVVARTFPEFDAVMIVCIAQLSY